jgi:hypothetical protein
MTEGIVTRKVNDRTETHRQREETLRHSRIPDLIDQIINLFLCSAFGKKIVRRVF